MAGFLYIFHSGGDVLTHGYKIGFTTDITSRLAKYRTSTPMGSMRLVYPSDRARELESALKLRFIGSRVKNDTGRESEWVLTSLDNILRAVLEESIKLGGSSDAVTTSNVITKPAYSKVILKRLAKYRLEIGQNKKAIYSGLDGHNYNYLGILDRCAAEGDFETLKCALDERDKNFVRTPDITRLENAAAIHAIRTEQTEIYKFLLQDSRLQLEIDHLLLYVLGDDMKHTMSDYTINNLQPKSNLTIAKYIISTHYDATKIRDLVLSLIFSPPMKDEIWTVNNFSDSTEKYIRDKYGNSRAHWRLPRDTHIALINQINIISHHVIHLDFEILCAIANQYSGILTICSITSYIDVKDRLLIGEYIFKLLFASPQSEDPLLALILSVFPEVDPSTEDNMILAYALLDGRIKDAEVLLANKKVCEKLNASRLLKCLERYNAPPESLHLLYSNSRNNRSQNSENISTLSIIPKPKWWFTPREYLKKIYNSCWKRGIYPNWGGGSLVMLKEDNYIPIYLNNIKLTFLLCVRDFVKEDVSIYYGLVEPKSHTSILGGKICQSDGGRGDTIIDDIFDEIYENISKTQFKGKSLISDPQILDW